MREFHRPGKYAPEVRLITDQLVIRTQIIALLTCLSVSILDRCEPPRVISDDGFGPDDQIGVSRSYQEGYEAYYGWSRVAYVVAIAVSAALSFKWQWTIQLLLIITQIFGTLYPCGFPSTYSELMSSSAIKTVVLFVMLGFPSWPHLISTIVFQAL